MEDEPRPFEEIHYLPQVEAGVRWWEYMRIWYNLLVITTGCAIIVPTIGWNVFGYVETWIWGLSYLGIINVFYFLGPLRDMYAGTFLKGKVQIASRRGYFFLVGLGLTLLVTMLGAMAWARDFLYGQLSFF